MKHASSLAACIVVSAACAAAVENIAAPTESSAIPVEESAPPALVIPFDFANASEGRVFADLPLPAAPDRASAVGLVFDRPVPPGPVRAVTVHLRSGDGWLSADLPVSRARGSVRIPFAAFAPEGNPGPAAAADVVRISLWSRAPEGTGSVAVASASLLPPAPVAVAGSGPWADRCDRLLDRIGVHHDHIAADFSRDALADVRVLFLPDASSLSGHDATSLRAFVRRGGRLFVFYSADSALAGAVGVRPGSWEPARSEWPGFVLSSGRRIPHKTGNRICPEPGPKARTVATWLRADGSPDGSPAVVLGPGGAWFAHVPPLAYPAACDLVSSLLSELAPDLLPPDHPIIRPSDHQTTRPPDRPTIRPSDFLLAAWSSAPPPRPLPAAADPLRALFVRIPVGDSLPKSADTNAPALHVWLPCLLAGDGTWRNPANPVVRKTAAEAAVHFVRNGAAGIRLDACLAAAHAAALVPGIGTGADESQTDLPAARAELGACVDAGCRGAAFFALDDALLELLPGLLSSP